MADEGQLGQEFGAAAVEEEEERVADERAEADRDGPLEGGPSAELLVREAGLRPTRPRVLTRRGRPLAALVAAYTLLNERGQGPVIDVDDVMATERSAYRIEVRFNAGRADLPEDLHVGDYVATLLNAEDRPVAVGTSDLGVSAAVESMHRIADPDDEE
ncbi:hypothetical protein [Nocardiopsis baichengensis]|uniref:hypothetical protein n=1 Tax=Nocardiopsis baichengensis TaxID=280240 RepID=UPI000348D2F8|nr:hypothetical protein [Nocardiopsis baichengensis]